MDQHASINQDLETFYSLVRRTRAGVLDWLETLPPDVFTREHESFAYGSLCGIYAHIADCYLWWVGDVGLGREASEIKNADVRALREAFAAVDATVAEALGTFTAIDDPFTWTSPGGKAYTFTQRWLILHPITHEFHHKGQALALTRVFRTPSPRKPGHRLSRS